MGKRSKSFDGLKPPETRIEEGGEGLQGRRLDGWLGNIPDIGQLPILGVPCIEGDSLRGGLHAGNLHFESEAARVLPVGYAARDEGNAREVELVHEGTHSLLADEGSLVVEVLVEDVVVHQSQELFLITSLHLIPEILHSLRDGTWILPLVYCRWWQWLSFHSLLCNTFEESYINNADNNSVISLKNMHMLERSNQRWRFPACTRVPQLL